MEVVANGKLYAGQCVAERHGDPAVVVCWQALGTDSRQEVFLLGYSGADFPGKCRQTVVANAGDRFDA